MCLHLFFFVLIHENFHETIVLFIYFLVTEREAFPLVGLLACILSSLGLTTGQWIQRHYLGSLHTNTHLLFTNICSISMCWYHSKMQWSLLWRNCVVPAFIFIFFPEWVPVESVTICSFHGYLKMWKRIAFSAKSWFYIMNLLYTTLQLRNGGLMLWVFNNSKIS